MQVLLKEVKIWTRELTLPWTYSHSSLSSVFWHLGSSQVGPLTQQQCDQNLFKSHKFQKIKYSASKSKTNKNKSWQMQKYCPPPAWPVLPTLVGISSHVWHHIGMKQIKLEVVVVTTLSITLKAEVVVVTTLSTTLQAEVVVVTTLLTTL